MKVPLVALFAAVAIAVPGCGPGATAASTLVYNGSPLFTSPDGSALSDDAGKNSGAAAYCRQTHGEVEVRHAVYGTNGSQLLFLAGVKTFCQYTRKKDGSRIHILLSTLYTTKPTLAALAYILKPASSGSCQGNPASCYCSYLGGSDQFGGTTGAGGGWYKKNAIDQTLEACIFPDMSSIDSWGLAYHSAGIIRGINLEKVMQYKYPGSI
jgi:hypothetical protein